MTLIRSNSFLPTVPSFFDDFFTRDLFDWGTKNNSLTNTTLPSVNIIENNDAFMVEMAAPGMEKKDFAIELENDMLTISSVKEMENELKEGDHYTRKEFSYQSFKRTFHLPKSVVEISKINAKYDNGILSVLIPKKEEAKALPPRKIKIM
jgi:HSP20 family protein